MGIRYEKRITRAMVRAEPDTLWVFGDNLLRKGLGGQAKEMRGEPNAVGIPTKKAPHNGLSAFFGNEDLFEFAWASDGDFARLKDHLCAGGIVVLPSDGIGTGLADLERKAPRIWQRLQDEFADLAEIARLCPTPSLALPASAIEGGTEP